jgi:starch phosphorylase
VAVELLVSRAGEFGKGEPSRHRFVAQGADATGEQCFNLDLAPESCGKLDYRIRVYPWHELLTHPLELGLMIWA